MTQDMRSCTNSFVLVYSDQHRVHFVRKRGYDERPARLDSLLEGVRRTGLFEVVGPRHFPEQHVLAVHSGEFVSALRKMCVHAGHGKPIYPYIIPRCRPARRPDDVRMWAGYYAIDTFTPLDANAYRAARVAVDVALTAAAKVAAGASVVYALCRPPGHHAGRDFFGGYCYFNNAAIAAEFLCRRGQKRAVQHTRAKRGRGARVAILDLDFHHGNGTQHIFYDRRDVLTVSIHGHPRFTYPFFTGGREETGQGAGEGYNLNITLPEGAGDSAYCRAVRRALRRIREFEPAWLVVPLGFDTAANDQVGELRLTSKAFCEMARTIRPLGMPTLIVQEGGYNLRNLRRCAFAFFMGLC